MCTSNQQWLNLSSFDWLGNGNKANAASPCDFGACSKFKIWPSQMTSWACSRVRAPDCARSLKNTEGLRYPCKFYTANPGAQEGQGSAIYLAHHPCFSQGVANTFLRSRNPSEHHDQTGASRCRELQAAHHKSARQSLHMYLQLLG